MECELHQQHPEHLLPPLTIGQGGTSAKSADSARINLGLLEATKKAQPNGIAPLDGGAKIPAIHLPEVTISSISLNGPAIAYENVPTEYQITNFDMSTTYTLSAQSGSITRNHDIITFTPTIGVGNVTITVNNVPYVIAVQRSFVEAPIFTNTATVLNITSFTTPVEMNTPVNVGASDVVTATIAEVATDAEFLNIVNTITEPNEIFVNLINTIPNGEYFIRTRFDTQNSGLTSWSETKQLLLYVVPYPSANVGVFQMTTLESGSYKNGKVVDINKSGTLFATSMVEGSIPGEPFNRVGFIKICSIASDGAINVLKTFAPDTDLLTSRIFAVSVKLVDDGNLLFALTPCASFNSGVGPWFARITVFKTTIRNDYSTLIKLTSIDIPVHDDTGPSEAWMDVSEDGQHIACSTWGFSDTYNPRTRYYVKLYSFTNDQLIFESNLYHPYIDNPVLGDPGRGDVVFGQNQTTLKGGLCISDAGDWLIVNSIGDLVVSEDPMKLFIFHKVNNVWSLAQTLSNGAEYRFGHMFALSGNGKTLIVADRDNNINGGIYAYENVADTWVQTAYWDSPYLIAHGGYASSLTINHDGSVMAVGVAYATTPDKVTKWQGPGVVLVYRKDTLNSDVWTQKETLYVIPTTYVPSSNFADFGTDIALSDIDKTLVVGAPYIMNQYGACFIYK